MTIIDRWLAFTDKKGRIQVEATGPDYSELSIDYTAPIREFESEREAWEFHPSPTNQTKSLHRDAMVSADMADQAQVQGRTSDAQNHLADALRLESQAADLATDDVTRNVLRDSAKHLKANIEAIEHDHDDIPQTHDAWGWEASGYPY